MKKIVCASVCVFVFVLLLLKTQAAPGLQEWTDFLTKVEQVCINKTGISKTVIDRTKVTLELPDEPQYKAYMSCFYKKQGYQNEDGDILFYNIKNMITDLSNSTIAVDIVNSCKNLPKLPSHEDYAYNVAKCLLDASKRKILLEERDSGQVDNKN